MQIKTLTMNKNSVLEIYSIRNQINLSPTYQRNGDLWNLEKKQLFIDSLIVGYDIPKLYLHSLIKEDDLEEGEKSYALIDGRQRLETIWEFIDNKFQLGTLIPYDGKKKFDLTGMYYRDLTLNYPKFAYDFDKYLLPITVVQTLDDDLEPIEEMFSRLNDAVSINSPEKRNALGGKLIKIIRKMTSHPFFKENVTITNKRFQHHEISVRLLFIEHGIRNRKLIDTKKLYLDNFVKDFRKYNINPEIPQDVKSILDIMCKVFQPRDNLLRSQARIPIYYLLFREAFNQELLDKITRERIMKFKNIVEKNKTTRIKNPVRENIAFSEYDRLTIQGTNDASSIKTRFRIIANYFKIDSSEVYSS